MRKVITISLLLIIFLFVVGKLSFDWYLSEAKHNDGFFESAILAFEASDLASFPQEDSIVFVGSSSIRFWKSLAEDMGPLPVIRRGFGGAHMSHVLYNFDRIITPYSPKAVVVFVGGNDIGSGKSAARVASDYKKFIDQFNKKLPKSDLWILAMKPSKLRWSQWDEMKKVDEAVRGFANLSPNVHFVNSGEVLLGPDGMPDDVYVFDGLHLNEEGYRRWSALLKPKLLEKYLDSSK